MDEQNQNMNQTPNMDQNQNATPDQPQDQAQSQNQAQGQFQDQFQDKNQGQAQDQFQGQYQPQNQGQYQNQNPNPNPDQYQGQGQYQQGPYQQGPYQQGQYQPQGQGMGQGQGQYQGPNPGQQGPYQQGPQMNQNPNQGPYGNGGNGCTYHYSYYSPYDNPQYQQQQQQQQDGGPNSPEGPKKKKKAKKEKKGHPVLRTIALILVCALVGCGSGFGGAALYKVLNPVETSTVIYQNNTDPSAVGMHQADGLTPMSLSEINAAYADACVCITVRARAQNGYYYQDYTGAGSGFIISEDGYIVTNYHVIEDSYEIMVTLNNGESYPASIIGAEELNDVAVLKLDGISGLKPVVMGDSDDLVVGETVCTIGNALGTLSFSLTSGTVSATGRTITMSDGTVMNMIQTNCTINSGNSGGPLFDSYGRVCGITSAKYSNNGDSSNASIEGIGFAIPINDVSSIIKDFIEHGYITGRPEMGITVATVEESTAQAYGWPTGVLVTAVNQGSCAQRAGLRQNDIITKIDDTDITDVNQMVSVKNSYRAGDTVSITVWRAGETISMQLTFDEQTAESNANANNNSGSGNGNGSQGYPGSGNGGYGYGGNGNGNSGNGYGDSFDPFDPWSWFFGY